MAPYKERPPALYVLLASFFTSMFAFLPFMFTLTVFPIAAHPLCVVATAHRSPPVLCLPQTVLPIDDHISIIPYPPS
ncbi:hypothetical protein DFH94DRAFT_766990 [Russula ochroleuca]|uniref:Uncharacterized protein n=1 Tax=Russula ochroleuca TaxID=152965 RepID=A0A9P5K061_9AGAM|nr:hypothetical protein DFH94DRAFT_766990 [Russula ochroleuca]